MKTALDISNERIGEETPPLRFETEDDALNFAKRLAKNRYSRLSANPLNFVECYKSVKPKL